jgi:hypothetical protein
MDWLTCPVCDRGVISISRWRGIYLCEQCMKKFEKIERIISNGQVLEGPALHSVLKHFGQEEVEVIRESDTVKSSEIKKKRKRKTK